MILSSHRKRLLYQATHRGTKEADLLLGGYVQQHILSFSETDLTHLEEVLTLDDEKIVASILGQSSTHAFLSKIRTFYEK